jgi:DNA modification methylase
VHLIKRVLEHATGPTDVILDFFAGSGTTAQAVMQINGRFTILAVKKNGGGSPRRGKGVNANPTPIPV